MCEGLLLPIGHIKMHLGNEDVAENDGPQYGQLSHSGSHSSIRNQMPTGRLLRECGVGGRAGGVKSKWHLINIPQCT